jgi:hypothetical protein
MIAEKQLGANRKNAQLSTRPKTPRGKAAFRGGRSARLSARALSLSRRARQLTALLAARETSMAQTPQDPTRNPPADSLSTIKGNGIITTGHESTPKNEQPTTNNEQRIFCETNPFFRMNPPNPPSQNPFETHLKPI